MECGTVHVRHFKMSKADLIAQERKISPQKSRLSNHYNFHLQNAKYIMQKLNQTNTTLWCHLNATLPQYFTRH